MLDRVDINDIITIAKEAGDAIMEIYIQDFDVDFKEDSSPLTQADLRANKIICDFLEKHYKDIPIISEENKNLGYDERKNWQYCWLVDPLDGTREFIKKNDEFSVNIALVKDGSPVLGVVYVPAKDMLYYAKQGYGAFKTQDGTTIKLPIKREDDKFIIVASKSHLSSETKEYIDNLQTAKTKEFVSIGSSLKLCLVAEGVADLYPRLAPTMEWDTAAADAVVRECGKQTINFENNMPLLYNKENLLNPYFIVIGEAQ